MNTQPESGLLISDRDYNKLLSILAGTVSESSELLEEELSKATVLPPEQIPGDVVTVNSTVNVLDLDTGVESTLILVFPNEADAAKSRISVLAPMGVALIGLRVGQVYEWKMPRGHFKRFKIVGVQTPGE